MHGEIDLDDLPPKVLRKMLRQMMGKEAKSEEDNEKEIEKADKEREDLADLHAQSRGGAPEIPVTKDDLPEHMQDVLGNEDEDEEKEEGEDSEIVPAKKKGKK